MTRVRRPALPRPPRSRPAGASARRREGLGAALRGLRAGTSSDLWASAKDLFAPARAPRNTPSTIERCAFSGAPHLAACVRSARGARSDAWAGILGHCGHAVDTAPYVAPLVRVPRSRHLQPPPKPRPTAGAFSSGSVLGLLARKSVRHERNRLVPQAIHVALAKSG
jgi:hypothetical protein